MKYKTVDFDVKTRASSGPRFIRSFEEIWAQAEDLLKTEITVHGGELRLRLMGVRLSNLAGSDEKSPKKEMEITKFFKPDKSSPMIRSLDITDSSTSSIIQVDQMGEALFNNFPNAKF